MVELLVAPVESGWMGPRGQPLQLFPVTHSAEGWRDVSPDVSFATCFIGGIAFPNLSSSRLIPKTVLGTLDSDLAAGAEGPNGMAEEPDKVQKGRGIDFETKALPGST